MQKLKRCAALVWLLAMPPCLAQDWAAVAERALPAVVKVQVVAQRQAPEVPDDLARFLGGREGRMRELSSAGSGFIVAPDGLIISAYSTLNGAQSVRVETRDGKRYPAQIVGGDELLDISLLKIEASPLPYIPLNSSHGLAPGVPVATLGSPFSLDTGLMTGVISATAQRVPNGSWLPYIQANLYTNRGQAGGPLLNAQGEAVGVISAIIATGPEFTGISLSTPMALVAEVLPRLKQGRAVVRPSIGIAGDDVWLQAGGENFERRWVVVTEVVAKAPAQLAGVQAGDYILAFNGQPVHAWLQLAEMVGRSEPGQPYDLRIRRGDAVHELTLTPVGPP
jgi:serine protease Do